MSMDKRSIYDGLNQLESELQNSLNNLAEMKQSLQEIVEKNTTLELEPCAFCREVIYRESGK